MKCRFCNFPLRTLFLPLGHQPLSNAYLASSQLEAMEPYYPLNVYICNHCFLVQLPAYETPENIFSEYAYFSSYSDTWLKHCQEYVQKMTNRFGINKHSFVVEIASNDGCLLGYFKKKGVKILGIEPARNIAQAARKNGIPTKTIFFGRKTALKLAKNGNKADLIVANNVLAHVPDLNDFVASFKILLKPKGFITFEFPHLMNLIDQLQFDTIYQEHFSYFSFLTVNKVFLKHNLKIFDVEEIPIHGGSLRIYVKHKEDKARQISQRVEQLKQKEVRAGLHSLSYYLTFHEKVKQLKRDTLKFFLKAKEHKKTIVAYGAAAKGNTLLNYYGLKTDFIEYVMDRNPYKQGRYLPGSHIPIKKPGVVRRTKPDYVLILPWNIKREIEAQLSFIRDWGGKFLVPIPKLEVL